MTSDILLRSVRHAINEQCRALRWDGARLAELMAVEIAWLAQ